MLEIGSLVDGKYKILSEIGRGGMSVVYMAINEKANKTWAVKEVRKDGKMDFNTVKQGLMAEIDTLKKLSHPNLPSIVDVIDDDDSFIIVMDYIEGRSLEKIIKENGAQPEAYVVEWAKQLCDVFGYLHSRTPAIIYRDMKPANVMLKPDGNIMVIDFGTAKKYEFNAGETTGMGTYGYAAPEQFIGSGLGRTDARTDIYCLGITLYHLLTNIDPSTNLVSDKSIRAVNPALSRGLDAIIQKCTQQQPNDRYQSCAELMYDLENYQILEPLYKKKQKRKLLSFFATIVMTILFAIAGAVLNSMSVKMAADTYDARLEEAAQSNDYQQKVDTYIECIGIPGKAGTIGAYSGLIQAFKEIQNGEEQVVFTVDEAGTLERLVKSNAAELESSLIDAESNVNAYVSVCFEIGKLYWYYYESGSQVQRAQNAIMWFEEVIEKAPEDYENIGMAKAYANIGIFYRDITMNITEANDKGEYKKLFDNLSELMNTIAIDETENELVRVELLEFTRSALRQYATKFKLDGVLEEEARGLCSLVENTIGKMDTNTLSDVTGEKKTALEEMLPETWSAIEAAYGTRTGGTE